MRTPDFKIPIHERFEAEFWLEEWEARFRQTDDLAFKELAEEMRRYINAWFGEGEPI